MQQTNTIVRYQYKLIMLLLDLIKMKLFPNAIYNFFVCG